MYSFHVLLAGPLISLGLNILNCIDKNLNIVVYSPINAEMRSYTFLS